MNCWYWMNRRNPCGGEVEEVGSVCDGQLLPNVWGSLVQSLALQHDKPSLDIKTFLNEINACVCPGSSSVNYRTMWNLEKSLFNLKVAAGESKGKVMWHDEKKKEEIAEKNNIQKGNVEARICVCGTCSLSEKNKAISFLRVSAKVETTVARVQTEALRRFLPLSTCLNTNLKHRMFKRHEWKERWEVLQSDSSTQPTEYAVPEAADEADLEIGYSSAVLLPRSRLDSQKLAHHDQV